ncbi:MAG TPA: DciA family protein [Burkholderiaceae bacterium]|nr:DciA family protein [Burkholderiaceae bacterium]
MRRPAVSASSQPLQSWLDRDPSLRELARKVDGLVALQAALQHACPQAPTSVAALDAAGTLTVVVPGAAWASRLLQIEPRLLAALAQQDPRVRKLKFRPRRELAAAPPLRIPRPPVPAEALVALERLHGELAPSPLRQALGGLLSRQAKTRR